MSHTIFDLSGKPKNTPTPEVVQIEPLIEIKPTPKKTTIFNKLNNLITFTNPEIAAVDTIVEETYNALDESLEKLHLPPKPNKILHILLKFGFSLLMVLLAICAIGGFMLHFKHDYPKLLEFATCLVDESKCTPDTNETLKQFQEMLKKENDNDMYNTLKHTDEYNTYSGFMNIENAYKKLGQIKNIRVNDELI